MNNIEEKMKPLELLGKTKIDVNKLAEEIEKTAIMNLPKLDNWEWWVETIPANTVLQPGTSKIVIKEQKSGWVWYGILAFSSSDMGFHLRLKSIAGRWLESEYTVNELIAYGLIAPTQAWWVSRADDSVPLYIVVYTPNAFPGTPFHRLNFWIINKGSLPGVVYGGVIVIVRPK